MRRQNEKGKKSTLMLFASPHYECVDLRELFDTFEIPGRMPTIHLVLSPVLSKPLSEFNARENFDSNQTQCVVIPFKSSAMDTGSSDFWPSGSGTFFH